MLLVNFVPKSNVFQMAEPINPINIDEISNCQSSESMINETRDSISAITIPLISSQPILAVSPNYILVDEYTKKRRRLIIIDNNLKKFFINLSRNETIIDTEWYEIEKKFFLLNIHLPS